MPKGYNALRNIQVNHLEIGICPEHGYLLTSEQCNCYPEQTALFFAAEQTKNQDWEADADAVHTLIGTTDQETEYRKSQLPKNAIASGEWLKRNTHANPQEKATAKANGEVLKAIRKNANKDTYWADDGLDDAVIGSLP